MLSVTHRSAAELGLPVILKEASAMGEPSKTLQEKHRTLRRLVIAQGDLFQSLRFAELILSHEGLEVDSEEEERKYKDIITALHIALVVAYSRPFLKSKTGRVNSAIPSLPGKVLRGLSEEQKRLHKQVLQQRNQEFAHSDADAYSPMISNREFGLVPIMRNPFPPPELERIESIKEILQILIGRVSEETQKLRGAIEKGKTLYA
jgi:hypothetical protein